LIIGNPDENDVTNRQLDSHIFPALEWMASELKYSIRTEENLILESGVREYPLPDNFAYSIWFEWNTNKLVPSTTYRWERIGTDWRDINASNPAEYAIQGRNIILVPPPSASAISTDSSLAYRYITSSPGMDAGGTPGLGDLDQQLVLYRAAIRYCRSHPTDTNLARVSEYRDELGDLIPAAKRRAENLIEDYYPSIQVHNERFGGAR